MKSENRLWGMIFLLLLSLALAGCGGDDGDDPPSLSQTYHSDEYGFSLRYPSGWQIGSADFADVVVANSEAFAVEYLQGEGAFAVEDFIMWVMLRDRFLFSEGIQARLAAGDPSGVADAVRIMFSIPFDVEATSVQQGGYEVQRLEYAYPGTPLVMIAYGYVHDDGRLLLAAGESRRSSLRRFADTALRVAASVTLD